MIFPRRLARPIAPQLPLLLVPAPPLSRTTLPRDSSNHSKCKCLDSECLDNKCSFLGSNSKCLDSSCPDTWLKLDLRGLPVVKVAVVVAEAAVVVVVAEAEVASSR